MWARPSKERTYTRCLQGAPTIIVFSLIMLVGGRSGAAEEIQGISLPKSLLTVAAIVGGEPARIEDMTWQVSIGSKYADNHVTGHFCSGSLIAPQWIITAAHCVDKVTNADQIIVVANTSDLRIGGIAATVTSIFMHEHYTPKTNDNDLALLKISPPLSGPPIQLIHASVENELLDTGTPVIISGWGYIDEKADTISPELQIGRIEIIDAKVCNGSDVYNGDITDNMICAGILNTNNEIAPENGAKKRVDACQGDSGGPLVLRNAITGPLLIGIISWGEGCGRENRYGVYTKVSTYISWVNSTINQ